MTAKVERNYRQIEAYYQSTEASYRRWGADPDKPGLYSLHFGFSNTGDPSSYKNSAGLKQLNREIIGRLEVREGMRVLDAGCGCGTLAYDLQEYDSATKVVGINVSMVQLRAAVDYNRRNQVGPYFLRMDYHRIGLPSLYFDRVVFCESFVHSDDKPGLLKEVWRLLKPGGILFLADYLPLGGEKSQEIELWRDFRQGWELPYLIAVDKFLPFLGETGFELVEADNLTERVMNSARILGESCRLKLQSQEAVPEINKKNRLASVAFYDLLSRGSLGYFFVKARRS